MAKSVIYLENVVENKNAHKLASKSYYVVHLVDAGGISVPALFTEADLGKAVQRASKNPEDVQSEQFTKDTWFRKLLRFLGICE